MPTREDVAVIDDEIVKVRVVPSAALTWHRSESQISKTKIPRTGAYRRRQGSTAEGLSWSETMFGTIAVMY